MWKTITPQQPIRPRAKAFKHVNLFNPDNHLYGRGYYCLYFTDEETEEERSYLLSLISGGANFQIQATMQ